MSKKTVAFLTSLVLCSSIIHMLDYFSINNDIAVIAETVNTGDFSCLVWEGTYNGSYNTNTKLNLRIHMTMGNGTAYVSVSEIGGTLSGSYSFTTEINGNTIIFTGTNGVVYGKTFEGIINPYTYNISGSSTNSTIQGNFSFKAGINTHNSKDSSVISQKDQINLSKYVVSPLDIVVDGNMNTKNYVELYTPNLEYFQYDNEEYNYDLSVQCAKYAALAYQNYLYDEINDIYYEQDGDYAPYILKNELVANGFKCIQNEFNNPSSYYLDLDKHNVSFTLAYKKVFNQGKIEYLTMVIIRGTDKVEWLGNMDVTGTEYDENCIDHYSFRLGANCVKENLLAYLKENGISNSNIVITGHSRGAAVGNLLAKDLTDMNSNENMIGKVYAYTYATPNATLNADENGVAKDTGQEYKNIYNYCFTDDFVPQVPLQSWGYNKYGTTLITSATDLINQNYFFKNDCNTSISKSNTSSTKGREEIEFDNYKCNELINYVSNKWSNVKDFYNLYLPTKSIIVTSKDGEYEYVEDYYEDTSLYEFFRETIAPAAMQTTIGYINVLSFQNNTDSNYFPIFEYFVDFPHARYCVNDNHQNYNLIVWKIICVLYLLKTWKTAI